MDTRLAIDILPSATKRAFHECAKFSFLSSADWYLAGGTALALQTGHRQSVDLDFFTPQASFRETALERKLLATGKWATTLREEGTLYGTLLQAKISFIAYPFFQPSKKRLKYGNIRILFPDDIAAMKIIAISQRGRKRDFIDLYWYCKKKKPLTSVLRNTLRRYEGQQKNLHHILKSLVYFTDAEKDPMPKIFFGATWMEVKKYFQTEVPKITREVLLRFFKN